MAYPYSMYADMFKKCTNEKISKEERDYLLKFADSSTMSSSKKIYNNALFNAKRLYPKILIRLIVTMEVKKILKNDNAPENIQKLYKEIAEILFYSAIGRYGKEKEIKYSSI